MQYVLARGGNPSTDASKLKDIGATNIQHHVWFQTYYSLNNYGTHTVTKKVNI
jgi:hypothetical protein